MKLKLVGAAAFAAFFALFAAGSNTPAFCDVPDTIVAAPSTMPRNLISGGTLESPGRGTRPPAGWETTGAVHYGYLGHVRRDISSQGFWLQASEPAGELSCTVNGLNASAGRWFRFTFRGLPQSNFAVTNHDLFMKVAFFGKDGTSYDAKEQKIYDLVETTRRDFEINGNRGVKGAEVWRTYQLDFYLPFPQVDTVRLSVGFGHGAAKSAADCSFFVDDVSLVRIPNQDAEMGRFNAVPKEPVPLVPPGDLLPLGGRWFYAAKPGEKTPPKTFSSNNADRLLYHDAVYSAPFLNNTTAWLRAGNLNSDGSVVKIDRLIGANVIVHFTSTALVITTRGVPNHPTGRFPEQGFGNPSYIQDKQATYYLPLNPKQNPAHFVTDEHNANGALPMGPIGLAVNGIVFFNPFDAGSEDATSFMDQCCGHPNPDNQYHYHKYPICVNSPWADEGKSHSPLLGWAFDGYPLYGPYEKADVMAKDVTGEHALNAFNMHYDAERGWHYHVTPGKFPYLIGGFWGEEDGRNRPVRRGGPGGGPPPAQ